MRVIAGKYRSRILKEVELQTTRSTKDRVKEAMFNSIMTHIPEAKVLDLFAGSGALGIEALSRGASHCVMVEHNRQASKVIQENIRNLKIDSCDLYEMDYQAYLNESQERFDLIVLDPPYQLGVLSNIVSFISDKNLLEPHGVIVCLSDKMTSVKDNFNAIIEYKTKVKGLTKISFLEWSK
jgi:16S rRNA (guanine(966)-N(2))-methyltransferase RsmD